MKHYADAPNGGSSLAFRFLSHIAFFYLYADFPSWYAARRNKLRQRRRIRRLAAAKARQRLVLFVGLLLGRLRRCLAPVFSTPAFCRSLVSGFVSALNRLKHAGQNFDITNSRHAVHARRGVYFFLALVPCFVLWQLSLIAMAFVPDARQGQRALVEELTGAMENALAARNLDVEDPFLVDPFGDEGRNMFRLLSEPARHDPNLTPYDAPLFRASVNFDGTAEDWEHDISESRSEKYDLVVFDRGNVRIRTVDGVITLTGLRKSSTVEPSHAMLDPFQLDMFSPVMDDDEADIPPLLYGEETDAQGMPRRWSWLDGDYLEKEVRECSLASSKHDSNNLHKLMHSLNFPAKQASFGDKRDKYQEHIKLYAEKYEIAPSLMLAIMHTESAFNPYAVSNRQAIGLMQIVPRSAGHEVYRFLKGRRGTPSHEFLFNPENNIKYGAVYLYMLGNQYFGEVSDKAARQMCVIAAYNGGPNAVLRMFHPNREEAIDRINSMTPQEVYTALTKDMPFAETRKYVELVLGRIRYYSSY